MSSSSKSTKVSGKPTTPRSRSGSLGAPSNGGDSSSSSPQNDDAVIGGRSTPSNEKPGAQQPPGNSGVPAWSLQGGMDAMHSLIQTSVTSAIAETMKALLQHQASAMTPVVVSSPSTGQRLPTLEVDGSNYPQWKKSVEVILRSERTWSLLTEVTPCAGYSRSVIDDIMASKKAKDTGRNIKSNDEVIEHKEDSGNKSSASVADDLTVSRRLPSK